MDTSRTVSKTCAMQHKLNIKAMRKINGKINITGSKELKSTIIINICQWDISCYESPYKNN